MTIVCVECEGPMETQEVGDWIEYFCCCDGCPCVSVKSRKVEGLVRRSPEAVRAYAEGFEAAAAIVRKYPDNALAMLDATARVLMAGVDLR